MASANASFTSAPPYRPPQPADEARAISGSPLGSALRELEARARLPVAVLLALDHPRIAGEEAFLLERGPEVRLEVGQRLGEAVTHRACLAGEAAASHGHGQVVLGDAVHDHQRLAQDHP